MYVCVCVLNLRDLTNCTGHYNFYVSLEYKHVVYISCVVLYCLPSDFISECLKFLF